MKPQATFESALAAIEFAENPLDLRYCTDADEREAAFIYGKEYSGGLRPPRARSRLIAIFIRGSFTSFPMAPSARSA